MFYFLQGEMPAQVAADVPNVGSYLEFPPLPVQFSPRPQRIMPREPAPVVNVPTPGPIAENESDVLVERPQFVSLSF